MLACRSGTHTSGKQKNEAGTMDDLRKLALEILESEKRLLLEEKEEYRTAVVVVVTPERRYWEDVEFDSEAEMIEAYSAIVDRAKENRATAIITVNTSFLTDDPRPEYRWGDLERDGAQRAIALTISGLGFESLSLTLPFKVENGSVSIGKTSDFEPAVIGLLPNWP